MARFISIYLLVSLLVACQVGQTPPSPTPSPASTEAPPVARATATSQPTSTSTAAPPSSTPLPATATTVTAATPIPSDASGGPILEACGGAAQQQPFRDDLEAEFSDLTLPLCYNLDFALNERGDGFDATARVTVWNSSEDEWPDLLFRLYPEAETIFGGQLEVASVTVDGVDADAERTLSDETGLRVPLTAPLGPGSVTQVEVRFSGELAGQGTPGAYGIFGRSEDAATIVSWFPLLAVWNDDEDRWFDVAVIGAGDAVFAESGYIQATLSAPDTFSLAVSGLIQSETTEAGRTTYEVFTGPARDLAMVWLEGYKSGEVLVDGTTIRNWYLPGDETSAEQTLDAARESLALFNDQFGAYPFEEVDIVPVPLSGAAGVEYPQLYLMGQELYGNSQALGFLGFVSAHEMAHQWWYSTVGSDINAAPWQDEALTNWSALLWMEEAEGETMAEQTRRGYEQAVENFQQQQGDEPISQPLASFQARDNAYSTIVYLKGALFFHALREEIGDDAFFAALQGYYAANRFGIAQPINLLDQFETESQRDLDPFYDEWGVAP